MLTDTQITPIHAKNRRDIQITPGDTIRVHQKIVEGEKTRTQVFEGIVIACKHGSEAGSTFTVRRVGSDGIAVEKIFPLYSPMIDKIEVTKRTKTRRAKLYFLRDKTPKQIREKLRRTKIVSEEMTNEPNDTDSSEPTEGTQEETAAEQPEQKPATDTGNQNTEAEKQKTEEKEEQVPEIKEESAAEIKQEDKESAQKETPTEPEAKKDA